MTDNHQGNTLASEKLLTSGEVAALFGVDPKTVARWVLAGNLNAIRTPGGQYRFREAYIGSLLNGTRS